MGLKGITTLTILIIISAAAHALGSWQGPAEIISGGWGVSDANFGIEYGDTSDRFPSLAAILTDGKIVISDQVNEREIIYNSAGMPLKFVPWYVYQNGSKTINPDFTIYQYSNVQGYMPDGNVWIKINNYILKSPTGQLVKTSTEKPAELGIVDKIARQPNRSYSIVIRYPERTYSINVSRQKPDQIIRDLIGNLYVIQRMVDVMNAGMSNEQAIQHFSVTRYNFCGKETGKLDLPENTYEVVGTDRVVGIRERVLSEYGSPVISSNGDVYTWKRTPDNYSILKWTWVDDPNVPSGPDAPSGLSVIPSTSGLYLTWTLSPNDPGCVTGYEIARATSAGGVFSTVGTVEKGVIKFNDTTAAAGTTYYYKVRAVAGTEYSIYTAEVSGKR